jgi:phosphonate transport system substrate-binding protein
MKRALIGLFVLVCAVPLVILASGSSEDVVGTKWQDEYPVISYSAVSSENEADRIARNQFLIDYLERTLGVEVEFFAASDYAGTIEAMRAGHVQFASYGTASYSRAWLVTDGNVEPLVTSLDETGGSGYHSTIWVRSDSKFESVEDLSGASIAFADPNSTSGYLVPSFYLRRAGMDPDSYFGTTGFSGNHEMGIMAIIEGTYDAACTWWTNEKRGNPQRMAGKDMIDIDDIKMIWTSPLIPNGPIACLSNLPTQMKEDFRNAMLQFPSADPEGYAGYFAPDPPGNGYTAVTHERYVDFIEMVKINDAERAQASN